MFKTYLERLTKVRRQCKRFVAEEKRSLSKELELWKIIRKRPNYGPRTLKIN